MTHVSGDKEKIRWSQIDNLFKELDGFRIAETLLGLCLSIPNRLGFYVAHKSSVSRSMPNKPEVFQLKTHIRFARKAEDASFPVRKKKG